MFSQTATSDWFDPGWMFGVEDGFNIVIGNPPYIRQGKIKTLKPILHAQRYETFVSTADIYVYFYEKGYRLLKNFGILCFVSSNKWMKEKYGENLRRFLRKKTQIIKIIHFGGFPVFEQTVDTCIIICKKQTPLMDWNVKFANIPSSLESHQRAIDFIRENLGIIKQNKLSEQAYTLSDERV
ncbi:MAG: Eco57I restriction-modification methylase domain-containing protein [Thermodesulfovibrio sp.]|nr:Eco57I restriction-modification methylase domain-containing protein [Thermodesulfovibrio sp.]